MALGVCLRIERTLALGNGGRLSPVPAPPVATICSTSLDSSCSSSHVHSPSLECSRSLSSTVSTLVRHRYVIGMFPLDLRVVDVRAIWACVSSPPLLRDDRVGDLEIDESTNPSSARLRQRFLDPDFARVVRARVTRSGRTLHPSPSISDALSAS